MLQTVQDKWPQVGGLNFHYRDWGGQGQPVVLLHGLASNCRIWDMVAPLLAHHFSVVTLDQRGHGRTDKPNHGYDFATVAGDLGGFIRSLGLERPVIVGHSWGGDVALEFAVARPGVALGLCFVDGGMIEIASRPGMTLERARLEMAPPDFTGYTSEMFRQRILGRIPDCADPEQLADIVLANFEIQSDNTIRARLSRDNHLRIIDALWEHRPSLLYPQVTCPVLLLPARQRGSESVTDRTLRREQSIAIATQRLPVSRTVWLEDSIHDVPLQRPQLVAEIIREHILGGFFG